MICELNFNASKMLEAEHSALISLNFKQFPTPETQPVFIDFLQKILTTHSKATCEVRLTNKENPSNYVSIEGIIAADEQKCLISLLDINERKIAGERILRSSEMQNLILENSTLGIALVQKLKFEWANSR